MQVVLYYSCVYFTKMSIVAFLFRLVGKTSHKTRTVLYCTAVFYTLLYAASVLMFSLECSPVSAVWSILLKLDPGTKCLDTTRIISVVGIFYAVGDVWLLVLPIPKICSLKLPWALKLGLLFVMSLGASACVGAIIKVVYL